MEPLNSLIIRAEQLGTHAANLEVDNPITGDAHHPGDDTGRLVLSAYREYGAAAMRSIVNAYLLAYNKRARELGHTFVGRIHFKNGIGWALPGASDDELEAIPESV